MYDKQLYGFSHELHIWSGSGISLKRYSFAVSLQTTTKEKMTEIWAAAISLY